MGQPHHPGPGNYPRRPGVGMDCGAKDSGSTATEDGIIGHGSNILARGRAAASAASASIHANASKEAAQSQRPSSVGGVHSSQG